MFNIGQTKGSANAAPFSVPHQSERNEDRPQLESSVARVSSLSYCIRFAHELAQLFLSEVRVIFFG